MELIYFINKIPINLPINLPAKFFKIYFLYFKFFMLMVPPLSIIVIFKDHLVHMINQIK